MSLSQIQKLERERAALAKKIAAERAKLAAKTGAEITKAFGEDCAEKLVEIVVAAARRKGAETVFEAVANLLRPQQNGALPNGEDELSRAGASRP